MKFEDIKTLVYILGAVGALTLNFALLVRYIMRRDIQITLMWIEYKRKKK